MKVAQVWKQKTVRITIVDDCVYQVFRNEEWLASFSLLDCVDPFFAAIEFAEGSLAGFTVD